MSEIYLINLSIFNALLIPVVFFSTLYYLVAFTSIFTRGTLQRFPRIKESELPTVSVQLPVYNDPVVARCMESCLRFDYPRDKYKIVVADDSTDPVTRKIIDRYAKRYPGRIKVLRREGRKGFKAGALNNALSRSSEDLIVIFDSDFVPKKNFLRKIVQPFSSSEDIAIAQSKTTWLNDRQNLVSRFASAILYAYYNCMMPITSRMGIAFLGGTGGAIRTSVLRKMGGWNEKSITEDSDLSVKILEKGYKSVYLSELEVSGEVPFTLNSLVKQQMRWAYGTTRVFIDNWKRILFSPSFNLPQRAMLVFLTLGYISTPAILGAALSGNLGWVLTPQKAVTLTDITEFARNLLITSGFFVLGIIGLYRAGRLSDVPRAFLSMTTVGIVVASANFVAFVRAVLGQKIFWFRTPKMGSISIYEFFKKLFRI